MNIVLKLQSNPFLVALDMAETAYWKGDKLAYNHWKSVADKLALNYEQNQIPY